MGKYVYLVYLEESEPDVYGIYGTLKQAKLGADFHKPILLDRLPWVKEGVVIESFNPYEFLPTWTIKRYAINTEYPDKSWSGKYEHWVQFKINWSGKG